jgi:hypothetical protein
MIRKEGESVKITESHLRTQETRRSVFFLFLRRIITVHHEEKKFLNCLFVNDHLHHYRTRKRKSYENKNATKEAQKQFFLL